MRHQELHAIALAAIRVYVEEQDRQVFGRAAAIGAIDLTNEVLLPTLAAPVSTSIDSMTNFVERLLGFGPSPRSLSVTPRRQPRFGSLVLALLRPAHIREELGPELDDPEWELPLEDPIAFTSDVWTASDHLLADLEIPVRLSTLLATAQKHHGFDAADLVRLRTLLATAPDLDAIRPTEAAVLAAVGDGQQFESATFAGDDLLVGTLTGTAVQSNSDSEHNGVDV
jgi:hypothetical protein